MIFAGTRRHLAAMEAATCYEEWKEAAIAYDKASGLVKWKDTDVSKHFDYASIRRRLQKLRRLRRKRDCAGILFALNEGIHGNIDGMGHGRLYNKARFGTTSEPEALEQIRAGLGQQRRHPLVDVADVLGRGGHLAGHDAARRRPQRDDERVHAHLDRAPAALVRGGNVAHAAIDSAEQIPSFRVLGIDFASPRE